jgi:hypothetical protein
MWESTLTLVARCSLELSGILLAATTAACTKAGPATYWPSGPAVERVYLTLECGGYQSRHLAVGDTARLTAAVASQRYDVVQCPSQPLLWPHWSTTAPEVLQVDSTGTVRALTPGRATVRVTGVGGEAHRKFMILPPVAQYQWEPRDTTVRIGDTVRLSAAARDRAGALVARLSASGLSHGDSGRVIDVLVWADTGLVLQAVAPGTARAFGRLGARVDSALIRVVAAPDPRD